MKKGICFLIAGFQFSVGIGNMVMAMMPMLTNNFTQSLDYGRLAFGMIIFISGIVLICVGLI